MSHHVFHDNDARVDDRADREGEAAKRHHVDRVTGHAEAETADQNRQEDRAADCDRRQQSAKKDPNDDADQDRAQADFVQQIPHRVADVARLVVDQRDLCSFRDLAEIFHRGNLSGDPLVNPVDDRNRVLTWFTQQRAVDAAFAVHSNDVVLNGRVVFRVADVADEDRFAVIHLDHDIVDVVRRGQRVERVNLQFRVVNLDRSGRENQVRLSHCLHDVRSTQAVRPQFHRVDIDHHLAELAAERMRNLHALQPAHAVAHGVITDRVKLFLTQPLAADRREDNRHVGRLATQCERPLDPRRQVEHVGRFEVDDVVHRRRRIGPGLKEHLDHGGTRNGARLLMLDPPGQRESTLNARRDALLHIHRGQTGIRKEADNHRLLEVRQNVDRCRRNDRRTEQTQSDRQSHNGERIAKRELNKIHEKSIVDGR